MKRIVSAATAAAVLCLFSGSSFAQGDVKIDAPGVKIDAKLNGSKNPGRMVRASKVIGAEIKNSENTSLGKVDDVIMDEAGRVHYLIATHGGVLGVGQKYVAIPLRSIAVRQGDSADTHWVQLNISPALLEKAPTFTSDKWPSFTNDDRMVQDSDKFFSDPANVKPAGTK